MKTLKGPGLFLSQFIGQDAPLIRWITSHSGRRI